ncbi:E3 ubiquitin ISG15 ligase TRIM25-like [Pelobates cultripes]|uniref:E3 ubiquitin ISG15 ligase TRIM25-like n=1 Tax=Pelobates cultripes TaxID=61616 RepID=A0AAD1RK58_PELCU|nr:E3 ubiquitin ISG15 ligase TRIM25-like [Pelobates cultripes]
MQTRKCATHQKLLKYNCCVDNVYVCEFCVVLGNHIGHNMELISDMVMAVKSSLEELLDNLIKKSKESENHIHEAMARKDNTHKRAADLQRQVTMLFTDLKQELECEERKILREITNQVDEKDFNIARFFSKKKEEKFKLNAHGAKIRGIINSTDPMTIVEKGTQSINKTKMLIDEVQGKLEVTGLNALLVTVHLEFGLLKVIKRIPQLQKKHGFAVQNVIYIEPMNANHPTERNASEPGSLLDSSMNLKEKDHLTVYTPEKGTQGKKHELGMRGAAHRCATKILGRLYCKKPSHLSTYPISFSLLFFSLVCFFCFCFLHYCNTEC